MDTMNALRAHTRGGPETLVYEEAPVPAPAPGEVQVAVEAAAITFDELLWDATWERGGRDRTPVTPSHEFAGIVSGTGPGVELAVGSRVYGMVPFDRDGAAAEYVVTPADQVAPTPSTLTSVQAAALPLAGLTAMQALVDHARLQADERVLVLGGAGGVGSYGVQLARHLGATVTATVRGHADFVRSLGAQEVIEGDRPEAALAPGSFDVLLDTVGGESLVSAYALLRPGGRLVTLQGPPDQALVEAAGITAAFFVVGATQSGLARLAELTDAGALTTPVAATFPLTAGRQAYESRGGHQPGKTVLVVGEAEGA